MINICDLDRHKITKNKNKMRAARGVLEALSCEMMLLMLALMT